MIGYIVNSGKLVFEQRSEYGYDCSAVWKVIFNDNDEHTIKEFFDEILKSRSNDWGDISIRVADCCYYYVVEYNHGKVKKFNEEIFNKFKDKPISKIIANGGWTNMSYDIYL